MPFILFSICLFLIFCALYGISSGVNAVLRLFSRGRAGHADAANQILQAPGRRAANGALEQCIADLDRLFELQQRGALTRHEFEALKHHLIQRAASAT
ncbi:hypothetical protein [Comamonas sp. UBA7528]|uniref:hypothetical protein n=1 Tax=Comamonas sp. UBA7528 TaxID=1946391 RepID=UPI0025C724D4|nr:hypothetical protein [Comamonas sp. UBA7528]